MQQQPNQQATTTGEGRAGSRQDRPEKFFDQLWTPITWHLEELEQF